MTGSVTGTSVRVGINPIDGIYGNGNDQLIGGTSSSMGGIVIGSSLSDDTRFYAGVFPTQYLLGLTLKPTAGDFHFISNFTGSNNTPVANADTLTATEDTAAQLLGNDTDVENNLLTIASVTSGVGGAVVLNSNGTVTFTSSLNFKGAASFTYRASDGTALSNQATVTVNVAAVNDAPVLANTSAAATFTEDGVAVVINSALTVTDVDHTTLSNGTVTITNVQVGDQLNFANVSMGNIAGTFSGAVLTLTSAGATATVAQWLAALRSVTFSNTSQSPNPVQRSVEFAVNDGTSGSNTITSTVNVMAVNDAPVFTSTAAPTVAENTMAVVTLAATDVDGPAQTVIFSIVPGADAEWLTIVNGNQLQFIMPPDYEGPTDANGDNVYVVTVRATDSGSPALSTDQTLTVTVTPVNDNAPVFTSTAAVSVAENTTAVTASDADLPPQTVSYSLVGGADQAKFSITASGALTFQSASDYEAPADANGNNVYVVTVRATDSGSLALFTDQTLTVTVTPVNDNAPVFTSTAAVTVAENTTAVTLVTANDADLPPQTLTFSIIGGSDAALFTIVGGNQLRFITAPDFEAPTDADANNVYNVNVQVSDGSNVQTQGIAVTVTNVTEVIPTLSIGDVTHLEGTSLSGTTAFDFVVTLSAATTNTVTVVASTADIEATVANGDYLAKSETLTFAPGETTKTVTVQVRQDDLLEGPERFVVNLTSPPLGPPINATIVDDLGVGTITNDDVAMASINDVTVTEGDAGTANANFMVTLSNPSSATVSLLAATAPDTATAGSDYTTTSQTLTFAPGVTQQTFSVPIIGDLLIEQTERFFVNLSNITGGAVINDPQGIGTILDNDNNAPQLALINPQFVTQGQLLIFSASATDLDVGQTLTYSLAGTVPAGANIDPQTGVFTWIPNAAQVGVQIITVRVTDNGINPLFAEQQVLVTVRADADLDGVPDTEEAGGPNGGDANLDGISDSQQANVASLRNVVTNEFVTLVSSSGTTLKNVRSTSTLPPGAPSDVIFPFGQFSFEIHEVTTSDGAAQVTMLLPSNQLVNSYEKFGPEPDQEIPHWYDFNSAGGTGATVSGNTITLNFIDGARGDADLARNGVIVDPGGPTSTPIVGLGDLPGGDFLSLPYGVSGDGAVVFGYSSSGLNSTAPFRWTSAGGMEDLTSLLSTAISIGVSASVTDVSFDGSVLVGTRPDGTSYRWSAVDGFQKIDIGAGAMIAVSSDGVVLVGSGYIHPTDSVAGALYWTAETGAVRLPTLSGFAFTDATAVDVSADGTVIVGSIAGWQTPGGPVQYQAVRWVADGAGGYTVEALGDLSGGAFLSNARAVSADGNVILGISESDQGLESFLWTTIGGMQRLGSPYLFAMSADASVLVGGDHIWDALNGTRNIRQVLTDLGVSGLDNWSISVSNISADGRTLVGVGTNPLGYQEAWRVVLPENHAPVLAPIAEQVLTEGQPLGFNAIATDEDAGQQLTYSLVGQVPAGVTIDPETGLVVWTTVVGDAGSHSFTVRVADNGVPARSNEQTVNVTVLRAVGSFQGLGDLPGGLFSSYAYAVSGNGAVVIGVSSTDVGSRPFRWTISGGIEDLSQSLGSFGFDTNESGLAVSYDGSVIVGMSSQGEAVRWSVTEGWQTVAGGNRHASRATGVSADGSVVVGFGQVSELASLRPFYWTASTGAVALESLSGFSDSFASAVSADGNVIVGYAHNISSLNGVLVEGKQAVRWVGNGAGGYTIEALGELPDGNGLGEANAVSTDGAVVFGISESNGVREAFRWTASGGMQGLGSGTGDLYAMSADGSVIVGEGIIWDSNHGVRSLLQVFSDLDVSGFDTWTNISATNISADGRTIVGSGISDNGQEAWLVVLP